MRIVVDAIKGTYEYHINTFFSVFATIKVGISVNH
jgi:hypothetical protein